MKKVVLCACVVLATTSFSESFSTFPSFARSSLAHSRQRSTVFGSAAEEFAEKLQKEFRDLQDTLDSEALLSKDEAADIAEDMLEKAIKIAGAQKDVEIEHISSSESKLKHALKEEDRAEALSAEAHDDAVAAEKQAAMLESMENDYDDLERKRDMSVAHAAHHLEEDAKAKFDASKEAEIRARDEEDAAKRTLELMENSEVELKAVLEELRALKKQLNMDKWKKASSKKGSDDDTLTAEAQVEKLKKEFKDLQAKLIDDVLVKSDKNAAAKLADTMIEKAIQMTGSQRDLETEHLDAAEAALKHAVGDEERAKALAAEAHNAEVAAEKDAAMLESMDNEVDDLERKRDLSVAHAAHHEEEDLNTLFESAKNAERHARDDEAEAKRLLDQLEQNEAALKETLKKLRAEKLEKSKEAGEA